MTTPTQNAIRAARDSRKRLSGGSITLRRKSGDAFLETVIDGVTVGETKAEEVVDSGAVIRIRSRDFFIDVDDYRIEGEKVKPEIDDQIVQEIDGEELVFQVCPYAGEQAFRRSFRSGLVWRVHTREA